MRATVGGRGARAATRDGTAAAARAGRGRARWGSARRSVVVRAGDESESVSWTPRARGERGASGREVECRTELGASLASVLEERGGDAFDAATSAALRGLVDGGFTAGEGVETMECDRDCVIGRAALTRMEVEDILYLKVARVVLEAGGESAESSSERRGRFRLTHRCQRLQSLLPEGSDDFMINLVLRVIENVSKNSQKVGLTYSVTTSTLADVYTKCASFGYFLQSSKRRFELEQHVSSTVDFVHLDRIGYQGKLPRYAVVRSALQAIQGDTPSGEFSRVAGYEVPVPLRVPDGIQIERNIVTLKQYIDEMGPAARAHAARFASVEAAEVLQLHVSLLFAGDRDGVLTSLGQFRRKPHRHLDDNVPDERVTVHVNQLKHIVLEACAFGAALAKTESFIDAQSNGSDSKPLLTRL